MSCKACIGKGVGRNSDSSIKPDMNCSGFSTANVNVSLKRMYHVLDLTAAKIDNTEDFRLPR